MLHSSVRAEWGLALGSAHRVEATVTGSQPSDQPSRTCTQIQIDVVWSGHGTGNFSVCQQSAGQFPAGTAVLVYATPGDPVVSHGESRASVLTGVSLESFFGLLLLLAVAFLDPAGLPWPADAERAGTCLAHVWERRQPGARA